VGELTRDFLLDISMGKVPGYKNQLVIAQRDSQNISDGPRTIWDHTENIQFLTAETELFVSSSSAADTAPVTAVICGLDGNFREKTTVIALTGQTQVSIGGFLIIHVVSMAGQAPAGDVYIAESDTLTAGVPDTSSKIQSKVLIGKNITHNGFFIVPEGKAAITMAIRGTTDAANKSAQVKTFITPPGGLELNTVTYSISESFPQFLFPAPVGSVTIFGELTLVAPARSKFEFRSEVNTNNTDVFFGIDFILGQSEEFLR